MIQHLRIQNFKAWKDTGPIKMTPITLFFGANSSGKSSIGQFLMMLKQTVDSPDRKSVFYPGGKNSAVQLGTYREMIFHHDIKNKIEFEYQWNPPKPIEIKDPVSSQEFSGNKLQFSATVGIIEKPENDLLSLEKFNYVLSQNKNSVISVSMEKNLNSRYKVDSNGYELRRNTGRPWPLSEPVRFYGFPDEIVAYYQNADFVQTLNLSQENLFRSLFYLGPLRTKTERIYPWGGNKPESVGYSGENTISSILAARSRKIGLGPRLPTKPFEEIIALKLKQMGLIENFKVNRISEQRQEYEVKVTTKGSDDFVDLPDVGFGVSQVLPVLVECFYAPKNAIILMEQPEIHLHPSAQSALADVMLDAIKSRENWEERNIQLIIETHSEYFLRRLQRRIAEDSGLEDKVAAYFADITRTPAELRPLDIDMYGNILNWPDNFFGDDMEDITGQSKAAIIKRMRQKNARTQA